MLRGLRVEPRCGIPPASGLRNASDLSGGYRAWRLAWRCRPAVPAALIGPCPLRRNSSSNGPLRTSQGPDRRVGPPEQAACLRSGIRPGWYGDIRFVPAARDVAPTGPPPRRGDVSGEAGLAADLPFDRQLSRAAAESTSRRMVACGERQRLSAVQRPQTATQRVKRAAGPPRRRPGLTRRPQMTRART